MYYRDSCGREIMIVPPGVRSLLSAEYHEAIDGMFNDVGGPSTTGMRDRHIAEREANHTGNHASRNHPIAVPTASGEPVRG